MSFTEVLDFLQRPLFTLLDTPVSWTEVLGFGSGALTVWLTTRQHIANWPVSIANGLFFIVLFGQAGLYADAGIQVVGISLACFGWWTWLRGGGPGTDRLPVRRTGRTEWIGWLATVVLGTTGLTLLLDHATDSTVPFWDAVTAVLSLLATFGQSRKRLEAWWLWIAADLIYIPLYVHKDLYLTSLLYIGFLTLCVIGLRAWSRDLATDAPPAGATP